MSENLIKIPKIFGYFSVNNSSFYVEDKLEKIYDKEYKNYEALILDFVMEDLIDELAILFHLNILDFNYFFDNDLYKYLNINYPLIINKLNYNSSFFKKINVEKFIQNNLTIIENLNLSYLDNTLFIKKLSFLKINNELKTLDFILNIVKNYNIEYNKFLISMYLNNCVYDFSDFYKIKEDLIKNKNDDVHVIYASLLNSFEKCMSAKNSDLLFMYEITNLIIKNPKTNNKKIKIRYLKYIEHILNTNKFKQGLIVSRMSLSKAINFDFFKDYLEYNLSNEKKELIISVYLKLSQFTNINKYKLLNKHTIKNLKIIYKIYKLRNKKSFKGIHYVKKYND